MPGYLIVSPQDWCDMWVSKHWIAHELSKRAPVLFAAPPRRVGLLGVPRLETVRPGLTAFQPVVRFRGQARLFGHRPYMVQLRRAMARLGISDPVVLNFDPRQWYFSLPELGRGVKLYYCVDPVDPSLEPAEAERLERRLCGLSHGVVAISELYARRLAGLQAGARVDVLGHGFDAEAAGKASGTPVPADLRGIPRPIAGYMGSVSEHYVDVDLLEAAARRLPRVSFVLVGPAKDNPVSSSLGESGLARLRALPNVHLLGAKPHAEVPAYIARFDAGLILHRLNGEPRKLLGQRTPYKLLQYLGQGKPVVSVTLEELKPLEEKGLVRLASEPEAFCKAIEEALDEKEGAAAARLAYARDFSYEKVLGRLLSIVEGYARP